MALKTDFIHKFFYNKKFVMAFSLVISFILWLVITLNENPIRDVTFSDITISVTTEGTAAGDLGLDLISMSSSTASVKISGPSYVLASLTANDISVTAPMDTVTEAGSYDIALTAASTKSGVSVVSITPAKVTSVFDYTDTKQYYVDVEAVGAAAVSGLVADTPSVSNSADASLDITGPRSELEKIARVVAVANVNETLSATQSFDAEIHLYDAEGKELDRSAYTIPVTSIKITVPILKQKEVAIDVSFANTPAGYSEKDLSYTVSASKVTILGPASTVDDIDVISLSPIDFDTISTGNNEFSLAPILPNGVKIADNITNITVKVSMSGISENIYNVSSFEFKNIGKGLSASAVSVKNVKLCGPRTSIRRISSSDLYAVADLTGKTAGEYTVPVRIYSRSYNNVWQVGTYNVVVTIK